MSALAYRLARLLWWGMLWIMRRPWMKWLQARSTAILPERVRPRVRESMARQNRFARRYGLSMLTTSLTLLLASISLTACFFTALWLLDSGYLTMSDELRERALALNGSP